MIIVVKVIAATTTTCGRIRWRHDASREGQERRTK
jgi:hypothetical protein